MSNPVSKQNLEKSASVHASVSESLISESFKNTKNYVSSLETEGKSKSNETILTKVSSPETLIEKEGIKLSGKTITKPQEISSLHKSKSIESLNQKTLNVTTTTTTKATSTNPKTSTAISSTTAKTTVAAKKVLTTTTTAAATATTSISMATLVTSSVSSTTSTTRPVTTPVTSASLKSGKNAIPRTNVVSSTAHNADGKTNPPATKPQVTKTIQSTQNSAPATASTQVSKEKGAVTKTVSSSKTPIMTSSQKTTQSSDPKTLVRTPASSISKANPTSTEVKGLGNPAVPKEKSTEISPSQQTNSLKTKTIENRLELEATNKVKKITNPMEKVVAKFNKSNEEELQVS